MMQRMRQWLRQRRVRLRLGALGMGMILFGLMIAGMFGDRTPHSSAGPISDVRFDQNLNAQVDLALPFVDENGQAVTLGDYLGARPVILMMGYYNCPRLCNVVFYELGGTLGALAGDLSQGGVALGQQYDVVTVSIDPNEGPADALSKQQSIVAQTGYTAIQDGWHFLTGQQAAIDTLADTVGFHFEYDDGLDQFAHPAGLVVLNPQGQVTRYLYDVTFEPRDIRLALTESGNGTVGTPVDQLLLLCYHYDPATGKYTVSIENVLRIAGIGTTLVLVAGVGYLSLSTRKRRRQTEESEKGED